MPTRNGRAPHPPTPGKLSAIPACLGFSPQSSIVALLIVRRDGNPELQNLLRMDIDADDARILTTVHRRVFRDVSAVLLVAIADTDCTSDAVEALDILRASFTDLGIATPVRLLTAALDRLQKLAADVLFRGNEFVCPHLEQCRGSRRPGDVFSKAR